MMEGSGDNGSILAPGSSQLRLTEHESQIVELIGCGKSLKQVGSALKIKPKTVSWHLTNIGRRIPGEGRPMVKIAAWYITHVHSV